MAFHPEGPTLYELAVQALSSTERGYDLLAPKFEATPFRTPQPILDAAAPHVGAPRSIGSALDICCGTGAVLRMLRPLCRERVVGLDFSRGMLAEAARRLTVAPGEAPARFVRADALAMPFEAEFDVAAFFGAQGHILRTDEPRFVAQVARVLKPGGRFVFPSAVAPPWWSARNLLSRGFNAAMRVRNWLIAPPFVMYYLTFLLPDVARLLESQGFSVEIRDQVFRPPYGNLQLVIATRQFR